MRRYIWTLAPFATALLLTTALASAAPQQSGTADDHPKLPPGEGRDVMIRVCSSCHDPEMVTDQDTDEKGWKTIVDQMAGNGAQATEEEFAQIVKYLAKAFPPK